MLALYFEGWFQCRLATNPDPTDELRGVSGYTFALAGEPDLDRIIRLEHPIAPRSHGPAVGVAVKRVLIDGARRAGHPLENAAVSLLDHPRFESRNLLLSDDRGGAGLIHPFHLQIAGDGVLLRRVDLLYPDDPEAAVHQVPLAYLNRRAPVDLNGMRPDPLRISETTGIDDPSMYRRMRRNALQADCDRTSDPVARAALSKRVRELDVDAPDNVRLLMLTAIQVRRFDIAGPAEVDDSADRIGGDVDADRPWRVDFWMGAWDADALCGFMKGKLQIPFCPHAGR